MLPVPIKLLRPEDVNHHDPPPKRYLSGPSTFVLHLHTVLEIFADVLRDWLYPLGDGAVKFWDVDPFWVGAEEMA